MLISEVPQPLHLTKCWWACLSWSWEERDADIWIAWLTHSNHPIIFHTVPSWHTTHIYVLWGSDSKRRWASLMKSALSFKSWSTCSHKRLCASFELLSYTKRDLSILQWPFTRAPLTAACFHHLIRLVLPRLSQLQPFLSTLSTSN